MIEVSIEPRSLIVGCRSQLAIRFANTGQGPCSDIVFKLGLPSGITLMSGRNRAEIPVIRPGLVHVHELAVEPTRPGEFELTSTNFSYRDEFDEPVRRTDFRWGLSVRPAPAQPTAPPARPAPRLSIEHVGGQLALGRWDVLEILARNTTGVTLNDVLLAVSGPFRTEGKRCRVPVLLDGKTVRASFRVIADEGGRHVPVSVRTSYSYPDGSGSVRNQTQEDGLEVAVVEPERPDQPQEVPSGNVSRQTILYLTASPQDLGPLRSDLEMRKVKERLQLARRWDHYRIEYCPATRLLDLTQALVDYEPQIVHFSGHADEDGNLCLEDDNGYRRAATPEGLAGLFGQHKSTIQCVIVNACYSMRLAEAMARRIDYVVGMRCQIGDEAAILFSVGFYQGLFAAQAVPDAFERGRLHLQAEQATELEYQTPVLLRRAF